MLPNRVSSSLTVARVLGSPANITATRYLCSPMSCPLGESTLSLQQSLDKGADAGRDIGRAPLLGSSDAHAVAWTMLSVVGHLFGGVRARNPSALYGQRRFGNV